MKNYYLWVQFIEGRAVFYVTDYKELNKDGKIWIDDHGYINAELKFTGKSKFECFTFAQKMCDLT